MKPIEIPFQIMVHTITTTSLGKFIGRQESVAHKSCLFKRDAVETEGFLLFLWNLRLLTHHHGKRSIFDLFSSDQFTDVHKRVELPSSLISSGNLSGKRVEESRSLECGHHSSELSGYILDFHQTKRGVAN